MSRIRVFSGRFITSSNRFVAYKIFFDNVAELISLVVIDGWKCLFSLMFINSFCNCKISILRRNFVSGIFDVV